MVMTAPFCEFAFLLESNVDFGKMNSAKDMKNVKANCLVSKELKLEWRLTLQQDNNPKLTTRANIE